MNIDLLQEILTNSTPGPWEWNRSDHTCWLGAPQIDVLRSISSGYSGETDIDIDEANARLIAMAPDLAAEVLRLRAALAEADAHRRLLWDLLDDIDTLDDACKGDDAAFRKQAYAKQQRRYEISTSDGYTVSFARAALKGTE